MSPGLLALTLVINWMVLFVALYAVTEYGHYYLYDEPTRRMGLKVAAGSLILALILTYTHTSFDTMLTDELGTTILQGIAWFAVFTLVLSFHPPHALGLGVATMLLSAGLAGLAVDSFVRSTGRNPMPERRASKPFRQTIPANPAPPITKSAEKPAS